jgi:hypothetical protein
MDAIVSSLPFSSLYVPPAWKEPAAPLLELPGVEYPHKLLLPAGCYSVVLVRTERGVKWGVIEGASVPRTASSLLRLVLGCEKGEVGLIEIYPPEVIGLPLDLLYRYVTFEEKIARYIRTETYNYHVVLALNERLEEARQAIDAHLERHLPPPMCETCWNMSRHTH